MTLMRERAKKGDKQKQKEERRREKKIKIIDKIIDKEKRVMLSEIGERMDYSKRQNGKGGRWDIYRRSRHIGDRLRSNKYESVKGD